jgi:hypothetical protein
MSTTAPTAYALQGVVSAAMQTLEMLRTEHGQVIADDAELLASLAEENVPVAHILTLLVRSSQDDKAIGAALDARIADMRQRRERFKRGEEAKRSLIAQVMDAVGLKSVKEPEFTLSLSAGKPKVIITDEAALPDDMVKIETVRTPDKAAILKALLGTGQPDVEFAEVIPGAVLSNGGSVLTVRSK